MKWEDDMDVGWREYRSLHKPLDWSRCNWRELVVCICVTAPSLAIAMAWSTTNTHWLGTIDSYHVGSCSMDRIDIMSSNDPSIHLSIHRFIYLSIYLSVHPSINPFIYRSINSSTHLSIHLSIHPSTHPSIHRSIYLSIHLSIHYCLTWCDGWCLRSLDRTRWHRSARSPVAARATGSTTAHGHRYDMVIKGMVIDKIMLWKIWQWWWIFLCGDGYGDEKDGVSRRRKHAL